MGQVHAAFAGQQEFAADRRHGVVNIDLQAACGQHLGRHQAGRSAANDGYCFLLHSGIIQRRHLLLDANPIVGLGGVRGKTCRDCHKIHQEI